MSNTPAKSKDIFAYWPLFALILVAILAASALNWGVLKGQMAWMHFFMGFIFCQFALLKIFNLNGFADGFQMYDILAKQSRAYAYVYPFIELGLGLAYLSFFVPILTYIVTIAVMAVSLVGVVQSLQNKLNINCACMGTVLNVPLSTVTLTEDVGMGLMALTMLIKAII